MNNKSQTSKKQQNFIKGKIKSMKLELDKLLSQPLIPKGVSTKYLTSGVVRDLADRLLDKSSCNQTILGYKNIKATDDFKSKKKSFKNKNKKNFFSRSSAE
ncbi:1880_t:CDS:2 [Entrophospora sp. SA101]|nr:14204_t:CDS:2 [Entrophospora sp. SA101]CAJ0889513.1 1880_t:CDS:2 [Entrophospora sp. SA101]